MNPEEPSTASMIRRMSAGRRNRRLLGYGIALLGTVAITLVLLPFRSDLTPLSVGFGFLVVVVVAAATSGLKPGILAALAGFLTFNFFFLPPYNTFVVGRGEYIVVLFVFLGLSVLISALFARSQDRAEEARARQEELQTLQRLSAELVSLVPGPDAYAAVLRDLMDEFSYDAAALFLADEGVTRGLVESVTVGAEPGELPPSWEPDHEDLDVERLPLLVGGRNLGVLALAGRDRALTPAESRVIRSFCDQFALILERDRLLRSATNAEVLRQAERVRKALLAAVSHDLRSPLAAIKASATDLLDESAPHDAEATREVLHVIDDEADRLNSLIADLLDMSRIEGGMLKAKLQPIGLAEIVEASVERLERLHEGRHVTVLIGEDVLVHADPVFVDRIVTNLLENALNASASVEDETIMATAAIDNGRAVVRVIDHGPGLATGMREQLFSPFYGMGEGGDGRSKLGMGLGLAITKGFVEAMAGQVWVEDTPGGGTTFAFSLPADGDERRE